MVYAFANCYTSLTKYALCVMLAAGKEVLLQGNSDVDLYIALSVYSVLCLNYDIYSYSEYRCTLPGNTTNHEVYFSHVSPVPIVVS